MSQPTPKQANTPSAKDEQKCRLLTLPGELRNRIYRLVLLTANNEKISISSTGFSRPALTRVNKQVRRETLKIFYYENRFKTTIHAFHPALLRKFIACICTADSELEQRLLSYTLSVPLDSPSWSNLMAWAKEYHGKILLARPHPPKKLREFEMSDMTRHVVGAMFETVRVLRKQPWKQVEEVLGVSRPTLITLDRRWEED
ncbi:uncharacterized protein MYCFIDRAFT_195623 [Pseudocercospora fijiensis CIRAD86]|uniref:F-box domain-containing protein n=1 Tax=Pseudocercospora fijiensis (strain CIRAD86) TaxID=383855 RepID=M3A0D7_PSEFD|nr:uncharacterized protein MYCFIDRAFT_195623 [Pseudocercospora fijiensis CIRAD86]EME84624.1 hypothetical protein MYCFIDRAFT_195623 [Pseudocercospora fijiensis CIRAD86]